MGIISLIWANPLLRYGALLLIGIIFFKGWLWTHDARVKAGVVNEFERKAESHASASIKAGLRADDEPKPHDRLREHWCRDC